jgi:hypothetical protein
MVRLGEALGRALEETLAADSNSLMALMERNYDCVIDPECEQVVLELLRTVPSIRHLSVMDIKKITRVAERAARANPKLFKELLPRLVLYHQDGIAKIRSGEHNLDYYQATTIEAHLLSHQSQVLWLDYKVNHQPGNIFRAIKLDGLAAVLMEEIDPRYSASRHISISNMSWALYDMTLSLDWLIDTYKSRKRAGDVFSDKRRKRNGQVMTENDTRTAEVCYGMAWKSASNVFRVSRDPSWALDWYLCAIRQLECSSNKSPVNDGFLHETAGNAALAAWVLKRNPDWKFFVMRSYSQAFGAYWREGIKGRATGLLSRMGRVMLVPAMHPELLGKYLGRIMDRKDSDFFYPGKEYIRVHYAKRAAGNG